MSELESSPSIEDQKAKENLTKTQAELSEERELAINRLKGFGLSEDTIFSAQIDTGSVTTVFGKVNDHDIEAPIVDFDWTKLDEWRGLVKVDGNIIEDEEKALKLAKTMSLLKILHKETARQDLEDIRGEQVEGYQKLGEKEDDENLDTVLSDIFK